MAYGAEVCLWGVGGDDAPVFMLSELLKHDNTPHARLKIPFRTMCDSSMDAMYVRETLSLTRVSLWGQHGSCNVVDRGLLLCHKIGTSPSVLRRRGATFPGHEDHMTS